MQEPTEQKPIPVAPEAPLSATAFILSVLQGVGVMLGLAVLWLFESIRNTIFRALDRFNLKARGPRRVSAFPPGTPRKQHAR